MRRNLFAKSNNWKVSNGCNQTLRLETLCWVISGSSPEELYVGGHDTREVAEGQHGESVARQGRVDSCQRDGVPSVPVPVAVPGQGPADLEP